MPSTVAPASEGGAPTRLCSVLRGAPHVMAALRAARETDPPDWLISAGAVRDAVWDALHGRPPNAMPRDIDLGYFDPGDLTAEGEQAVTAGLRRRAPHLPWQAKNQAAVLWYPRQFGIDVPAFRSSAEAVATFPETATCVGVRLLPDGDLLAVAPHGLDDLFDCICRHNPTRVPASFYERRIAAKGWRSRWPRMQYALQPTPHESGPSMVST